MSDTGSVNQSVSLGPDASRASGCHIVALASDTAECQRVASKVAAAASATVISIERVQRPWLWTPCAACRGHMVKPANDGFANEIGFFHGTDTETIRTVSTGSNQSFDKTYTRVHLCGKGVHFARDASCSVPERHSKPDRDAQVLQRMCLARVVVGAGSFDGALLRVNSPVRDVSPC